MVDKVGAVVAIMENSTVATWGVGRLLYDLVLIPVAAIAGSTQNICYSYHLSQTAFVHTLVFLASTERETVISLS